MDGHAGAVLGGAGHAEAETREGADLFIYMDLAGVMALMAPLTRDDPEALEVLRILDAVGLRTLKAFGLGVTLRPDGIEFRSFIRTAGPREGITSLLDGENSALLPPRFVPPDAFQALTLSFDVPRLWQEILRVAERIEEGATAEIGEGFDALKQELGVDVERDLIGSLGKTLTLYQVVPKPVERDLEWPEDFEPPPRQRMVIALRLADPEKVEQALGVLLPASGLPLEREDYLGVGMHALDAGPARMGLAVVGRHLVLATDAEDLKEVIRNQNKEEYRGLVDTEEFRRALGGLPRIRNLVSYADPRPALDELSDATAPLAALPSQAFGEMSEFLDLSLFPGEILRTYMRPGASVKVNREDGVLIIGTTRLETPK